LPPDTYEFDFEDGGDGSLSERFAGLLHGKSPKAGFGKPGVDTPWLPHVRMAHWLHECIIDSKLSAYPFYVLFYLQSCTAAEDCLNPSLTGCGPTALTCSATAVDQLLTVEQFYRSVRGDIGASHGPLLSEDFLIEHCAAVRKAFAGTGSSGKPISAALRCQYFSSDGSAGNSTPSVSQSAALAAVYTRLHGLPGHIARLDGVSGAGVTRTQALCLLPRLRRQLPSASADGLQVLFAALTGGGA
jgi:hypothetical protein